MTGPGPVTNGLAGLLSALDLEASGPNRFRGGCVGPADGVIFGGQLLAQMIVAAARCVPDKSVRSLHTVFARAGSASRPVEIDVDAMHSGRAFASLTVSVSQAERLCARGLVLLDADEADLIRHADGMPSVDGPQAVQTPVDRDGWEVEVVGGVDVADPAEVGPPSLPVWTRFPGAPADAATSQALLAYASDGFLIGTAMRPHPGVGQSQAHVSVETTVLTHTLSFHEPFEAGEWMLLDHHSSYAGRGRAYGRANVFSRDGRLVASYVQDSMIRAPR